MHQTLKEQLYLRLLQSADLGYSFHKYYINISEQSLATALCSLHSSMRDKQVHHDNSLRNNIHDSGLKSLFICACLSLFPSLFSSFTITIVFVIVGLFLSRCLPVTLCLSRSFSVFICDLLSSVSLSLVL